MYASFFARLLGNSRNSVLTGIPPTVAIRRSVAVWPWTRKSLRRTGSPPSARR